MLEAHRQEVAKEEGIEEGEGPALSSSRRPKKLKTYSRGKSYLQEEKD